MGEAITRYRNTSYPVSTLVAEIERGAIALPELQRPFVWSSTQVRNLFDSLYRGFPVGQIMFWETGANGQARQVGMNGKTAAPRLMLVDGQQRLTGLYAVITGRAVLNDEYRTQRIRLAFRPRDGSFEVATSYTDRDPEYLADVTELLGPDTSTLRVVKRFLARMEQTHGALAEEDAEALAAGLDRLSSLGQVSLSAVELDAAADEEEVADIFVRINSEGTSLNQGDFLLTLLSVWLPERRRELDVFARQARRPPEHKKPSPFNHHFRPQPDLLLRVAASVAFRRGRLKTVYQLLRGKDLESGEIRDELRDERLAQLADAQDAVLNVHNWHEFLRVLETAGFRSDSQISSEFAVAGSYGLWLIGKQQHVPPRLAENVIARWFLMAQMTGRYSGSAETRMERDLRLVSEPGGATGWVDALERTLALEMSEEFFAKRLPDDLDARSWRNRALAGYDAALVILDAPVLFSPTNERVRARLDPSVVSVRGVERHHLYPRAHLSQLHGITGQRLNSVANRPANAAWVDWIENINIAAAPPSVYWDAHTQRLSHDQLEEQMRLHALPAGWQNMAYDKFLDARRALMAEVVGDAYQRLVGQSPDDGATDPRHPAPQSR